MTGTPAQPKARVGRPGPLTGVCVGPFRLCHVLGSGAAGCVYLGAHTERPDFRVAVKVVPKLGPRSPAAAAAISREVAALKALQHEGIVSLLDLRENSRYSYLITEYADGGDLFRRLSACGEANGGRPTGLPVPFLRRVVRKVAEAMLHAATLGFCHRDIKVENILVSRCGQHVKLADWGFSAIGLQSRGTRCGSPHYVAPEIISQPHYNGFAADVWSLGVTAFVLATGYMAFATEDRHELSRMIMEGRVDWGVARAAGLPDDLMSLLFGTLCVDPRRRLGLREVLDHPFLAADADLGNAAGLEGFGATRGARRTEAAVIPSSWSAFHEPDDSAAPDEDALLSLCDLGLGESNVATVQELVRHPARSRYGGLERTLYALIARHHRMQDENVLLQTPGAAASCRGERMIVEGTPDRPASSRAMPHGGGAQMTTAPACGPHPAPMKLHANTQNELYAKMAHLRGITN